MYNSDGEPVTTKNKHANKQLDQDQAAQNVKHYLRSLLSAILEHCKKKITKNLPVPRFDCRIKISNGFIRKPIPSKASPCLYVSSIQVFLKHCGKTKNFS